jgi:hypothetical protein
MLSVQTDKIGDLTVVECEGSIARARTGNHNRSL